jgi:hypothetical protein
MFATHSWLPRESKSSDSTKAHIANSPSTPVIAKTPSLVRGGGGTRSSPAKLRELTGGVSKSF